jgi:hypothetical protein
MGILDHVTPDHVRVKVTFWMEVAVRKPMTVRLWPLTAKRIVLWGPVLRTANMAASITMPRMEAGCAAAACNAGVKLKGNVRSRVRAAVAKVSKAEEDSFRMMF